MTIWEQPLTDSEESIIERVLEDGTPDQTRKWLNYCLKILKAQKKRDDGS